MHMMNWPYKICIFQIFPLNYSFFTQINISKSTTARAASNNNNFFSLIICYYPTMQIEKNPPPTYTGKVLTAVKFHNLTSFSVHQLQSSSVVACTQHGAYQHFVISHFHLENLIWSSRSMKSKWHFTLCIKWLVDNHLLSCGGKFG